MAAAGTSPRSLASPGSSANWGWKWRSRSYLRILGCERRFISCTSRSMLLRLLVSLFIFSTMICPDWRCCTWRGVQGWLSPTCLHSPPQMPACTRRPPPALEVGAKHPTHLRHGAPQRLLGLGGGSPSTAAPQGSLMLMTHNPILPRASCLLCSPHHTTLPSPPGEAMAAPASHDPNPAARTCRCRIGAHQRELFQVSTTQPDPTSMEWSTEEAHRP